MESLLNRFPLRDRTYRDRFKKSVKLIVQYGVGVLVLLPDGSRGAGFGTYALNRMLLEKTVGSTISEARKMFGVNYDAHDCDGAISLLKIHCPEKKIQLIMNSPSSILRNTEYITALNKHAFDVKKWLFLESEEL